MYIYEMCVCIYIYIYLYVCTRYIFFNPESQIYNHFILLVSPYPFGRQMLQSSNNSYIYNWLLYLGWDSDVYFFKPPFPNALLTLHFSVYLYVCVVPSTVGSKSEMTASRFVFLYRVPGIIFTLWVLFFNAKME